MIDTAQHIPVSKPNQQNTGMIYCNSEIPSIMTLDELSKLIIHLTQIYRYAVQNNVQSIMLRK
jgi:hypothetical protein